MACENLATKADIEEIKRCLSQIKSEMSTKQDINRLEQLLEDIYNRLRGILSPFERLLLALMALVNSLRNGNSIDYDRIENMHRQTRNDLTIAMRTDVTAPLTGLIIRVEQGIIAAINRINFRQVIDEIISSRDKILAELSRRTGEIIRLLQELLNKQPPEPIDYDLIRQIIQELIDALLSRFDNIVQTIQQVLELLQRLLGLFGGNDDNEDLKQLIEQARDLIISTLIIKLNGLGSRIERQINGITGDIRQEINQAERAITSDIRRDLASRFSDLINRLNSNTEGQTNLNEIVQALSSLLQGLEQRLSNLIGTPQDNSELLESLEELTMTVTELTMTVTETITPLGESISGISLTTTRLFSLFDGDKWFSGGEDVTPSYFLRPERRLIEGGENVLGSESKNSSQITVTSFPQLIESYLGVLHNKAGYHLFPIQTPENLTEKGTKEIEFYTQLEFNTYLFQQLVQLLGQFPIEIEIEDSEVTQEGNQRLNIELPNLAESIAELYGLIFRVIEQSDIAANTGLRNLVEIGVTKENVIKSYYLIEAIQEYLGFSTKRREIDIAYCFNPLLEGDEIEDIAKFLETKEVRTDIEINDDDDTLEGHMGQLLQAATITRASLFRSFPAQLAGQFIKDRFQSFLDASKQFSKEDREKLEDFIDELKRREIYGFEPKITVKDASNGNSNSNQQP